MDEEQEVVDFSEENPGKIEITISDHIYIKTNLPPVELSSWLDQARLMIITGGFEAIEKT